MSRWDYSIVVALLAAAFVVPLWPLGATAVVYAALRGHFVLAVAAGLFLDIVWGVPTGLGAWVYAPFTLLASALGLARYLFAGYFLDRRVADRL